VTHRGPFQPPAFCESVKRGSSVLAQPAARGKSQGLVAEDPDTKKRRSTTAAASPVMEMKGTQEHRCKGGTLEDSKYNLLDSDDRREIIES